MPANWVRERIEISEKYGPDERQAIGLEVVNFIRKRSKAGKDKKNKPFRR